MKDRIIKLLGGVTQSELQLLEQTHTQSKKSAYDRGFKDGLEKGEQKAKKNIKKSYGWLKHEIHRKLDIMFPGKEYHRARYRWLRRNTMTTTHISQMSYDELVQTNKHLDEEMGGEPL